MDLGSRSCLWLCYNRHVFKDLFGYHYYRGAFYIIGTSCCTAVYRKLGDYTYVLVRRTYVRKRYTVGFLRNFYRYPTHKTLCTGSAHWPGRQDTVVVLLYHL